MNFIGELRMRPNNKSKNLLSVTRARAKMLEFHVTPEHDIETTQDPIKLITISLGLLGDVAASINRDETDSPFISELKNNLLFSARFFDSYVQSKKIEKIDSYLILLGSASYNLCDLPGSSLVLAKLIDSYETDFNSAGLGNLLLWLLKADLSLELPPNKGPYAGYIDKIYKSVQSLFIHGTREHEIIASATALRSYIYKFGTPRNLLLGDVIGAVLKKKIENSAWKNLPLYSRLPQDKWLPALKKESFLKELWPAQHLLGKSGVFNGKSAVVQMPTSAGKTKATEIIIRSAFLAERASLAVIVAPFRALSHEIQNDLTNSFLGDSVRVNELSDDLQIDFDIGILFQHEQVIVTTPEKFIYILRHEPTLATRIGLVIFDEGHQFDSGTRGITYELLLTSLRSMLPKETQKVLISAVISNAQTIGEWLNENSIVVAGSGLIPTSRTVGFTSWENQLGMINYINENNPNQIDFFVPRVIETINLGKKGRERNNRYFPQKNEVSDISLYLGLKLVPNGSVAIFCGTKATAAKICKRAVEIIKRSVSLDLPGNYSDFSEIIKLTYLHTRNLGMHAPASQSAQYGIFSHHGNMPYGIRVAVEHAMRNNLIRFVVCTSTLAQGVNLPIRYLIINNLHQGKNLIKIRDFQNLIGRAGRAGMHTEGSIIFANPKIFKGKNNWSESWRWNQVIQQLSPNNSEPCTSNLLSIFDPITSSDGKKSVKLEINDFIGIDTTDSLNLNNLAALISQNYGKEFSLEDIQHKIHWKLSLISAIESFLLAHLSVSDDLLLVSNVNLLVEETLAYFLANDTEKQQLRDLFQILAHNIASTIKDQNRRQLYSKTFMGIKESQAVDYWVHANLDSLIFAADKTALLDTLWPLFTNYMDSSLFTKFDNPEVLKEVLFGWVEGKSFTELLQLIEARGVLKIAGNRRESFTIGDVVDLCEGVLAYKGALLMSAVCKFVDALVKETYKISSDHLKIFQKSLRYGLPDETTINLYELCFPDRVIAQEITSMLNFNSPQETSIFVKLAEHKDEVQELLAKYPSYFHYRLSQLIKYSI